MNNPTIFYNNNDTISICSICNNDFKTISDPNSGELICSICGIVLSEEKKIPLHPKICEEMDTIKDINAMINTTGKDLQYDKSKNLLRNIESHTIIGRSNVDATGHKINIDMQNKIDRLRIWEKRTKYVNSKGSNLVYAFNKLTSVKHKLWLSDTIVEKSFYIYKKASIQRLIQGRTTEGILSAAIYLTCKELENPKTLKEISDATNVKIKTISRYSRFLISELDLNPIPVIDPMKCIIKISSQLNLEEKIKRKAVKVMKEIMKEEIHLGKNPLAIAASTIYLVCNAHNEHNKTRSEISKSVGISEISIRDRCNDINKKIELHKII